ncbi:MAG TPA: cytochrome c oxidase assembly protein [Caldimonas sp.]|nr:cytochrome c oxidase assembly protein [Caldimonas sp.]HEX4233828.1 cytochrome c oxidase assembly protein [Caldimonas sp.]
MHRLTLFFLALLAPCAASAHTGAGAHDPVEHGFLVFLVASLLAGGFFYASGVRALWSKAGVGRGVTRGEAVAFALGWAALAASLLGPIDGWSERSFAVHMTQHELLMVVAAPLIVLGRPLEAWTWAASSPVQRLFATTMKTSALRALARLSTFSLGAWLVHALALWLWHLPALFRAALSIPLVHILQHACFFGSALAYWWTVFDGRRRHPKGSSIASLFTTMLHTSALGALLTFAPSPWYAADGPRAFGLSPLEDQQLGGLIMWIPGGLAYMIVGLVIVIRWLSPRPRARPAPSVPEAFDGASLAPRSGALSPAIRRATTP